MRSGTWPGAGLVVVPMGTQPTTGEILARVTGHVGRFIWPSSLADPPIPRSRTSIESMDGPGGTSDLRHAAELPRPGGRQGIPAATRGRRRDAGGLGRRQNLRIQDPSRYRFSPPSNQPVTAEAVRHSIERALSPKLGSNAPGRR